ncbi:MAG: YdbH domain-containing protein [Myxococcota bacterium]
MLVDVRVDASLDALCDAAVPVGGDVRARVALPLAWLGAGDGRAEVELAGAIDGAARIALRECARVRSLAAREAPALTVGAWRVDAPRELCIVGGDGAPLALDVAALASAFGSASEGANDGSGGANAWPGLRADLEALALRGPDGARVRADGVRVELVADARGGAPALRASGRALAGDGWPVGLEGLSLEAPLRALSRLLTATSAHDAHDAGGDGAAPPARDGGVRVAAARVASTARPPAFAPLRVDVELAPDGAGLRARGTAVDASGAARIAFEARHDARARSGALDARLADIDFSAPGAPSIAALVPPLAGWVDGLGGRLGATASLAWSADAIGEPALSLRFDDVDLETAGEAVRGLAGDVELVGLAPPRTRASQTLRFRRVDALAPLADGDVRFAIERGGRVRLERATGRFAGGWLRAVAEPADASGDDRIVLRVARLDARRLAALAGDAVDLEATGTLWGKVPLVVRDGGVAIDGAVLAASQGGVLRYRARDGAGAAADATDSWALLRRALADFRYERLEISADGPLDGEMSAHVELRGSSPAVEDGRPIELRVRLSGGVAQVFRSALFGNAVVERLRERLVEAAARGAARRVRDDGARR